ncbi:protocatechuate 3,4-dioxygenase [Novosphingobium sp.]|uniref:DODA-type extradiol aromatic ring-opening family dioxygenase n=1 Tax=Novosphingobium sp. TaxID=1874826 RepID=UPI0035B0163B
MAQIVGGFIMPHAPHSVATPPAPPPQDKLEACQAAFDRVKERIRELEVDTVIVIGDDHYTLHGPHCIPSVLIGIGDVSGPVEPWLDVPRVPIVNNEPLARHIMSHGHNHGVDWAYAKSMVLDHSCYVPWHHAIRGLDGISMIPVYLNAGVDPLIPTRRCYEVGQAVARAVAEYEGADRVAIYGTGGMSHWPGMARMGQVNEEWDRHLVELIRGGDVEALIALSDQAILADGGNGGLELKNWVCAMGAFGECTGDIIAYQAMYEWVCGCAWAELKEAA